MTRAACCLVAMAGLLACLAPPADARRNDPPTVDLQKRVLQAIEKGNLPSLQKLIYEEKAEIDYPYAWINCRAPMLSLALWHRKLDLVKLLLEEGADVDKPALRRKEGTVPREEEEAYTPLMFAVRVDFLDGIKLLLDRGAKVEPATKYTPLMVAAAYGKVAAARALIDAKANLESRAERLNEIREFSSRGFADHAATADLPPGGGATALWIAAAAGRADMVKLLLDAGADREVEASCEGVPEAGTSEKECSPGRIAALRGHHDVAKLLGEHDYAGATVEIRSSDLRRIEPAMLMKKISIIIDKGDVSALEAYLDEGLDPNLELRNGEMSFSPLFMACSNGSVPLVKLLLDRKANPNAMVINKVTVRMEAMGRTRIMEQRLPVSNPLMAVVSGWKCEECVDLLLDAGSDLKATDWRGLTPLAKAAEGGNAKMVARLIAAKAPLESAVTLDEKANSPVVLGATPLWIAAFLGSTESVRLLLEAGADPDVKAFCGQNPRAQPGETTCTARRVAELNAHAKVVAAFDGGDTQPVPETSMKAPSPAEIVSGETNLSDRHFQILNIIMQGDLDSLKTLLDAGIGVNDVFFNGRMMPLLSLAVRYRKNNLFDLLLERGASVETMSLRYGFNPVVFQPQIAQMWKDWSKGNRRGVFLPEYSPLMFAVMSKNQEGFDRLLKAKADVNAQGIAGTTALMLAAQGNQAATVRQLIAAGARLEEAIDNPDGDSFLPPHEATALWLAASHGAADAVRALLEAGAAPLAQAECGNRYAVPEEKECNARRIAEILQKADIVRIIDEHGGESPANAPPPAAPPAH